MEPGVPNRRLGGHHHRPPGPQSRDHHHRRRQLLPEGSQRTRRPEGSHPQRTQTPSRTMTTRDPRHGTPRAVIHRAPILPERVRSIGGHSFAFLPHRFLREGFFASLRPNELRLYVLLVLAADRHGLSFYHYDSIFS